MHKTAGPGALHYTRWTFRRVQQTPRISSAWKQGVLITSGRFRKL